MNLLICGGRKYDDYHALDSVMKILPFTPSIIIEGGAKGADSLARQWAVNNNIHYAEVPALWNGLGRGAGPARNTVMLLLKPDYCIALPGGSGTQDMIEKCKFNSVIVWEPYK